MTPVLAAGISVGVYFIVVSNKVHDIPLYNDSSNPNVGDVPLGKTTLPPKTNSPVISIYDKFNVFPEITNLDYYKYIEMKDGKPIITDEMIACVINDIVSRMQITGGDLDYGYEKVSDQEVIISFVWHGPHKNFPKNYKLKVS